MALIFMLYPCTSLSLFEALLSGLRAFVIDEVEEWDLYQSTSVWSSSCCGANLRHVFSHHSIWLLILYYQTPLILDLPVQRHCRGALIGEPLVGLPVTAGWMLASRGSRLSTWSLLFYLVKKRPCASSDSAENLSQVYLHHPRLSRHWVARCPLCFDAMM